MNSFPNPRANRTWTTFVGVALLISALVLISPRWMATASAAEPSTPSATTSPPAGKELQVEVTKKGLGKEVSIKKGNKEWFMLIEVTPENTVVVRQEKENETYLVDESETHDRPMTQGEVDVAIEDFINSVKTKTKGK